MQASARCDQYRFPLHEPIHGASIIIHGAPRHADRLLRRHRLGRRRVRRARRLVPHAHVQLCGGGSRLAGVRGQAAAAGSSKATKSSSSARTALSGSSRSGAVCSIGASSCRLTTARPRTSSCASLASLPPAWCSLARTFRRYAGWADTPVWRMHELDWSRQAPLLPSRSCVTMWRKSSSRRARRPSPRAW